MRSSHHPNSSGAPQDFPGLFYFLFHPAGLLCLGIFCWKERRRLSLPRRAEQIHPWWGGMVWFPHYNQSPVPSIHLLESLLFPLKSVCSWLLFPLSPRFPAGHPPCPCPCPPPWSRVPSPWSRVPSPCFWGRGGPPSPRAPEVLTSLRLQLVRGYYSLPHLENYSFFRPFRNFNELF